GPFSFGSFAAFDDFMSVGEYVVSNFKGLFGIESKNLFDSANLVIAKCRAVDRTGVLLIGCGPSNDRAQVDERWAVCFCLRLLDRVVESFNVFDVIAR